MRDGDSSWLKQSSNVCGTDALVPHFVVARYRVTMRNAVSRTVSRARAEGDSHRRKSCTSVGALVRSSALEREWYVHVIVSQVDAQRRTVHVIAQDGEEYGRVAEFLRLVES